MRSGVYCGHTSYRGRCYHSNLSIRRLGLLLPFYQECDRKHRNTQLKAHFPAHITGAPIAAAAQRINDTSGNAHGAAPKRSSTTGIQQKTTLDAPKTTPAVVCADRRVLSTTKLYLYGSRHGFRIGVRQHNTLHGKATFPARAPYSFRANVEIVGKNLTA